MGTVDYTFPQGADEPHRRHHTVEAPEPQPFLKSLQYSVKETLFPDDPFRQFKNQNASRKVVLGLQYFFPICEWAPRYNLKLFKSDLIAGITIASLAIPQGISYAKLANLPPILGLYSSFVPPLVYAVLGSSRDLAVGTTAVGSLLMGAMLSKEVNAEKDPKLYLHLAFTATFFAGVLEASLGIFRLGFIVDFLSHATIVGFMGGAATVVSLQQLKGIFGLKHFTEATDIISVMRSVFSQTHQVGDGRVAFSAVVSFSSFFPPDISPRTAIKGNIPNSMIYRNTEQYPYSRTVPGLLILEIDAPIYFANAGYLRERITRWINEEEERVKTSGENSLQYVILDMSAVGNIDTSGISMMEEIKKIIDRRALKLVLANPKGEVVKKLTRSKFIDDKLGREWMFLTVGEAVEACRFMLHTLKTEPASKGEPWNNV
ncbi:hypothetical protein F2Q70_00032589 [Brassica cretica]|uniref:STAS domain-containing protein n=2 Tax=Brassica cretica TaxID=69181 RepID=A0A8S9FDU4_BRACR|nr:hypothetical protein F2Q70_00032589 [Brassica cretica]